MKLLAIFILHKINDEDVKILQSEFNLDHLGYFQRRSVRQFLTFSGRTAVQRTDRGIKQTIEVDKDIKGVIHIYVRSDGLAAALISDDEYPKRVAHDLLSKVMHNFTEKHPASSWNSIAEGSGQLTTLNETFMKYQVPENADPLMNLQKELEDTKIIMVNNIGGLLKRGEDLDTLAQKSADLSIETKILFKRVERMNKRCCNLFS